MTERDTLLHFLAAQRRSAVAILDGLAPDAAASAVVPSGWTPDGLLVHLGHAEHYWFAVVLGGATVPAPPLGSERADDYYRARCAASDALITAHALTDQPAGPVLPELAAEVTDLRGIVLHMIEETARHAGHLDLARELLDGRTGLGPR